MLAEKCIRIKWDPPANNGGQQILGYRLWKGLSTSELSALNVKLDANASEYKDFDVLKNITYYYAVTSGNTMGESLPSPVVNSSLQVPITRLTVALNPSGIGGQWAFRKASGPDTITPFWRNSGASCEIEVNGTVIFSPVNGYTTPADQTIVYNGTNESHSATYVPNNNYKVTGSVNSNEFIITLWKEGVAIQNFSSSDGNFQFTGLSASSFAVVVEKEYYYPSRKEFTFSTSDVNLAQILLTEYPPESPQQPLPTLYSGAARVDLNNDKIEEDAKAGDLITVLDSGQQIVGAKLVDTSGIYRYLPVASDDPSTIADEGASSGETLIFRINEAPASPNAVKDGGGKVITGFNISTLGIESREFTRNLRAGLNRTSISMNLDNPSVEVAVAGIRDKIEFIWGKKGSSFLTYYPNDPVNSSLTTLEPLSIYYISIKANSSLYLKGIKITPPNVVKLKKGMTTVPNLWWNVKILDVIKPIFEKVDSIWERTPISSSGWNIYSKIDLVPNNFNLTPTSVLYIFCNEAADLPY